MSKPKLLDLFCCAGGAAMGYSRAGFDVVGVDINPQPRYPFEFHQGDALEFVAKYGHEFDAIHASPPCQRYSSITATSGNRSDHPDLIEPVRYLLNANGRPWIMENVPRSPLRNPVTLCGVALGLRLGKYVLRRHRLFESSIALLSAGCGCYRGDGITMGVYGGGTSTKERNPNTNGGRPYKGTSKERKEIMDMPWASAREVNQAIPPAYTEYLGKQLIQQLAAQEQSNSE